MFRRQQWQGLKVSRTKSAFQGMTGQTILAMLEGDHRLEKPKDCPDCIYELMRSCWSYSRGVSLDKTGPASTPRLHQAEADAKPKPIFGQAVVVDSSGRASFRRRNVDAAASARVCEIARA
ncbi:unnamed protein product [Ixodes pacificus]